MRKRLESVRIAYDPSKIDGDLMRTMVIERAGDRYDTKDNFSLVPLHGLLRAQESRRRAGRW